MAWKGGLPPKLGLGLEGQVLKYIDITNFFSYTYYTDHKNGHSWPESRNLDKSRPEIVKA